MLDSSWLKCHSAVRASLAKRAFRMHMQRNTAAKELFAK